MPFLRTKHVSFNFQPFRRRFTLDTGARSGVLSHRRILSNVLSHSRGGVLSQRCILAASHSRSGVLSHSRSLVSFSRAVLSLPRSSCCSVAGSSSLALALHRPLLHCSLYHRSLSHYHLSFVVSHCHIIVVYIPLSSHPPRAWHCHPSYCILSCHSPSHHFPLPIAGSAAGIL